MVCLFLYKLKRTVKTFDIFLILSFFGKWNYHCRATQCANHESLLSHIVDKNFVKVTLLLKIIPNRWFHEIFSWWERISRFSTLLATKLALQIVSTIWIFLLSIWQQKQYVFWSLKKGLIKSFLSKVKYILKSGNEVTEMQFSLTLFHSLYPSSFGALKWRYENGTFLLQI